MRNYTRFALSLSIVAVTLSVSAGNVSATNCANTYTARRGDSWWSIAVKSNITLKRILTINNATMSTIILIGDEVCVPAAEPVPVAIVAAKFTPTEVEQIIRDAWPDDLEDRAIAIARRESNLAPRAANFCCYGLFQIYYRWHKSWLTSIGITRARQLLDPKLNALAAYKLYQRNGWGPWE
jgi:hypothetical protein